MKTDDKKQRTANSAQAQPEKGMRLCAARYMPFYTTEIEILN
jgi:hypothetical protein